LKLGVLSDTHNNLTNLQKALRVFRQASVETVLHCGDLTDLQMGLQLVEFRVICTFGNNDWNANEICQNLLAYGSNNFGGMIFRGEVGGVKIAATHGHLSEVRENLAISGEFSFVFFGHSHRQSDEWVGITRVINPGALGGAHYESRSFVILDLISGKPDFHTLD